MRIEDDIKLDFKDVLIRPKRSTLSTRSDVELTRLYDFKYSGMHWEGVPVIAANMDTIGTFEMHMALQEYEMMTALHKHYSVEEWKDNLGNFFQNYGMVTIGTSDDDLDSFTKIYSMLGPGISFVCIDVANGYGEYFPEFVSRFRERFPDLTIIAGNVVTDDMTEQLILSGADIVKVGIGPGSVCTTRMTTGVGYPQISAIIECADAAHGLKGHIISDGGCREPGDVVKAFAAGADFVMLGGMFAGHDESGGEVVNAGGRMMKEFYGMSSKKANDKYSGGLDSYRAAEGRDLYVDEKGPVSNTVQQILGGLRSACTYVGAEKLKHLSKCTTFIRVTQQHAPF